MSTLRSLYQRKCEIIEKLLSHYLATGLFIILSLHYRWCTCKMYNTGTIQCSSAQSMYNNMADCGLQCLWSVAYPAATCMC